MALDSDQQQQQQSNAVKYSVRAIRYLGIPLVSLLLCPFAIAGAIIFGTLFAGPLVYYRSTILNSDALTEKYDKEGVRLQGKIIKRWTIASNDGGPTYHVRVVYKADEERYVNEDMTVGKDAYVKQTLDLIRLRDFPKSAIVFASIEGIDRDFPPSMLPAKFFVFFWMSLWNLIPLSIILSSIEACDCAHLIWPIFCGLLVFELMVGYWVAKRQRNIDLKSTLYGAKRVARASDNSGVTANDATPKHLSYSDFFDEGTHSCFSVISNIVLDFITVVAWIGVAIYFAIFGGGYIIMYSLVVFRWRNKLLKHYESEQGIRVSGAVACRQGSFGEGVVIVKYTIDGQMYKTRLLVPYHMVRVGCAQHRREYETIPDDPVLLYIYDYPSSATLKCQIDNQEHERKRFLKLIGGGLYVMTLQIFLFTLILGASIELDWDQVFLLTGILCSFQFIFGLVGASIHHKLFFKRDLLWGAKRVSPRATESEVEKLPDEEQELDIAVPLDQGLENSTLYTLDESVSTTSSVDLVDKCLNKMIFV